MEKFSAQMHKIGGLVGVDVPARVSRAFGKSGYVPVLVTIGDQRSLRLTLNPRGQGRHVLFFNAKARAACGAAVGDRVTISLRVDTASREIATPDDIAQALRGAGVLDAFEAMGPGKRRHIIGWIAEAKHAETRARRIAKLIGLVSEKAAVKGAPAAVPDWFRFGGRA